MEVVQLRHEEIESASELFSRAIEDDGWVLYHSTTSIVEDKIDAEGLSCSHDDDEDLIAIIKIFRAMNWAGDDSAGYAVIKGFSLQRGALPHLFFRESSTRSLIYAQADFAGGETARAMHHCFEDLRRYANDPAVRARHYDAQIAHCKQLVQKDGCPTHVIRVDLDWLNVRLRELAQVADRISQMRREYRHGVVYAARFTRNDVPFLLDNGGSGIVCTKPVPKRQLVGKARLHFDGKPLRPRQFDLDRFLSADQSELKQLLRNRPRQDRSAEEHLARERACTVEAFAGPDEAAHIAMRWGTPVVKQMVSSGKITFNEF